MERRPAETLNICPHKSVNDWFQENLIKKLLDINSKMTQNLMMKYHFNHCFFRIFAHF